MFISAVGFCCSYGCFAFIVVVVVCVVVVDGSVLLLLLMVVFCCCCCYNNLNCLFVLGSYLHYTEPSISSLVQ